MNKMHEEIRYNVVKVVKGSRKGYLTYYATDVLISSSMKIVEENLSLKQVLKFCKKGNN